MQMRVSRFLVGYLFAAITLLMLVACQDNSSNFPDPPLATSSPGSGVVEGSATLAMSATEVSSQPATPTPPPPVIVVEEASGNDAGESEDGQASENGEATPLPLPEGLIGPDDFPSDVNPLTGERVNDPALLDRRPLAIKISNAPAIVRPQSGLNNADLMYEHYAEGGLTRFTAVFYSKDANPIGSIRSGRLIDIEIPQMYDAAFAYSGSSGPLQLMFRNGAFFDRIISPDFGHGGFFRVEDPNKAFEHTLFTSSTNLHAILEERGNNSRPQFNTNMAFSQTPLTPGEPVNRIEIRYDATIATWVYNAATGRYTRWTDGVPHTDANSGDQLNFRNIVVVGAHHEDTDFLEDNVGGGHYSIQIQIWGQGPVSIFRDGQRFEGVWRRDDPSHMLTFYEADGRTILPLAPGNSFFQLVPLGFDRLVTSQ